MAPGWSPPGPAEPPERRGGKRVLAPRATAFGNGAGGEKPGSIGARVGGGAVKRGFGGKKTTPGERGRKKRPEKGGKEFPGTGREEHGTSDASKNKSGERKSGVLGELYSTGGEKPERGERRGIFAHEPGPDYG